MRLAQQHIAAAGRGILLYVRGAEGRGIGLTEKIRAYGLQDRGHDTVDANVLLGHPADARDHGLAADVLRALDVCSVALMTNNPAKCEQLEANGVRVAERLPLVAPTTPANVRYLDTKRQRMGHLLDRSEPHRHERSAAVDRGNLRRVYT